MTCSDICRHVSERTQERNRPVWEWADLHCGYATQYINEFKGLKSVQCVHSIGGEIAAEGRSQAGVAHDYGSEGVSS
jgi:hypothetical protein